MGGKEGKGTPRPSSAQLRLCAQVSIFCHVLAEHAVYHMRRD